MKKISKITWLLCSINFLLRKSKGPVGEFKEINGYKLTREIKNKGVNNYYKGIYTKNRKKYFIKIWSATEKDYFYYSIINEFNITSILYRISNKVRNNSKINFVEPIELVGNKNSIIAVYEYINGKTLDNYSLERQANTITKISTNLPKYTKLINSSELKYFSKRGLLWYFILVPYRLVSIKTSIVSKIKIIYRLTVSLLTGRIGNSELEISHRDLTPENVLIGNKGKIFLLDLEQVCLSFKGFDRQSIFVAPQNKYLLNYLGVRGPVFNKFLTNIIAIHAMSGESIPEFIEYYSKFINIF